LGGDVDFTVLRQFVEALNRVLRHDDVVAGLIGQRVARAPAVDLVPPRLQSLLVSLGGGAPEANHVFQYAAGIANDRNVDADILVDRGGIDVDVDLLGIGRECIDAPRNAVIEARADAQHDVAIMHGHVGFIGAVHAQHAEPVFTRCRIGTKTHQGGGDRDAGQVYQITQQVGGLGACIDDAAARIDDGTLRGLHQLDGCLDRPGITLNARRVTCAWRGLRGRVSARGELDVFRDVDHNRAWPAGPSHMKSLVQDRRQFIHVADQPVVLGARTRDANRVAFLEGVRADQRGRDLTSDADEWNGIHQSILERRDGIRGARTRSYQHHANLAGRASVAFSRMPCPLLVANEDVLHLFLLEKLVVDREYGSARVSENMLDAVILQRLYDHFGARHLLHSCL